VSASKRPSTSSLRRFITSRPYVTVAELRRRFSLDDPDAMAHVHRNGTSAWIGLPEREATKLQELWHRDELGMELSVEVRAPVVVGMYPMRIARYVMDSLHPTGNGHAANGQNHPAANGRPAMEGAPNPSPAVPSPRNGTPGNGGIPSRAPDWGPSNAPTQRAE
jgi:hypothetical protein